MWLGRKGLRSNADHAMIKRELIHPSANHVIFNFHSVVNRNFFCMGISGMVNDDVSPPLSALLISLLDESPVRSSMLFIFSFLS